jgi:hypothetical protein
MQKIKTFAAAMLCAVVFSSCENEMESTYVGFRDGIETPDTNLVYDGLDYVAKFDTTVNELFTVEQTLRGNILTCEGEQIIDGDTFSYNLNLNVKFNVEPKQVYVLKKEQLSSVAMTSSSVADEVVKDSTANDFTLTSVERDYEFVFNEGEKVASKSMYEKLSHLDTTFSYAEISRISYKKSDSKLNETKSNEDSLVHDVNFYFEVEMILKRDTDESKTYLVRVPVERIYKEEMAEAVTEIKDVDYKGEFAVRENELYTVEQYVSGYYVTTLKDKEVGRKMFKYDLDLNVLFNINPKKVTVDSPSKLTDVALKSATAGEETKTEASQDEFTKATVEREYEFVFNEGEVVTAKSLYQYLYNKDMTFAYAEIRSVTYKKYEAVMNSASSEDVKIYDIKLYFEVDIVGREGANVSNKYEVVVTYQRLYHLPAHYVPETVIENVEYVGRFDTIVKQLFTVRQELNGDFVTYTNDNEEISRDHFKRKLNLEAIFDIPAIVYVGSKEELATVSLASSSKDGNKEVKSSSDGFTTITRSQNYNFKFNCNEKVVSATGYDRETYGDTVFVYSSINNITYKNCDVKKNEVKSNADSTVYDVILYFNVDVKREETKTKSTPENHLVAVPYARVLKHAPEDVLVRKSYRDVKREILSSNTEKVSFTEFEIWSVSGEKNVKTISKVLNFGFNNPSAQTVYTTNTNYQTISNGSVAVRETSSKDGNWTVYTQTNNYSSTANNGHKSFNNKYSYNSQKAVYTNEYYTVEFGYGSWSVNESSSNVGSKSGEIDYNGSVYEVYPYVNNVSYIYDVNTDSYTGNGKSTVNVCIEKEVDSVIPEDWGRIIGAGISAVPADDVNGSYAKKCLCIRTENGAVSIVFDMNTTVPSLNKILSGNFVEGNYDATYNSGVYYNGNWEPAIAKDLSDRIAYYQGNTCMRNIRHTTLQRWNWRNGNMSTVVEGYSFSVSNDVLTVYYNSKIVMQLR